MPKNLLTVAVFNLKGGTGKSTTTLNLGAMLAQWVEVTVVDLDGQRTLSYGLGLDGAMPSVVDWLTNSKFNSTPTHIPNLALIPGDIRIFQLGSIDKLFKPALQKIKTGDVVLIDCAPSLSPPTIQALLNCDRVLLPTLCEPAALKGLAEAIELIRGERRKTPIDVLRTRYRHRLALTKEIDQMLVGSIDELDYYLLYTTVPENIQIAESIAHGKPINGYARRSSGAIAYEALAQEVGKRWGLTNG